jgi:hypothetical protein
MTLVSTSPLDSQARAERAEPTSPSASPKGRWRRRLKRGALGTLIGLPVLVLLLWIAVHNIPWLGPALADGLRSIVGTERVSRLEDFVYGVEDRWNQFWRKGEPPKAYWEVPSEEGLRSPEPLASSSADERPMLPPFRPGGVGPMLKSMAAKGDGSWVPVADTVQAGSPILFKTLIHPDRDRPWAEVFVVAVDLRQAELHLVAGSVEPIATVAESRKIDRPAVIPKEHHEALLAAFNGGFKMEHGRWGMRVGDHTLIEAHKYGCTVALHKRTGHEGGELEIAPWSDVESREKDLLWWRQTPPCMYRAGKRHGGLWDPDARGWGAALEGDTVIRRSAIGLDDKRTTLFVSVTNHTSAQALANAMHHAGAVDVAQLDVNWSFPKFVTFPKSDSGQREPVSLFEGFKIEEGEYIREPARRDFFYLTRAEPKPED